MTSEAIHMIKGGIRKIHSLGVANGDVRCCTIEHTALAGEIDGPWGNIDAVDVTTTAFPEFDEPKSDAATDIEYFDIVCS